MFDNWVPSISILVLGTSAIIALYNAQHKARQTDIWNTFTQLEIIAMGVKQSNWPMEFLIEKMQAAQENLAGTEMTPILASILKARIP